MKKYLQPTISPKRQYFDNILIVFWVMNATFLQLLNLEYVEHIKNIPKSNIISTLISYNAARIIVGSMCL